MSVIVLASEKAALELLSLTLMARVIPASDESCGLCLFYFL